MARSGSPVKDDPPVIQHDAAGTQLAYGAHVVADVQNRPVLLVGRLPHLAEAFLLKRHVAYSQHLVHHQYLAVQMSGHRKGQLDVHTG